MEFEWHEDKRLLNIEKHFLDFLDAPKVLGGPLIAARANTVEGEVREMAIGLLDDVCVAVIYTRRGSAIRLISMRRARKNERQRYKDIFGA